MKKALVIFMKRARELDLGVKMVANVHDEWQFECSEVYARIAGELAVRSIIDAGEEYNLRCPLDGEYKIGRNWRETH
jgi:DNA polymerase I-like protein with 3'-5' exonuclease and polymerase domains